ncbi:hypothetical protein GJ496_008968 [Pomphorhynchus laevis]|nr:hypothetical protein GJ496_008968 [Pomphorhynchus laevis]
MSSGRGSLQTDISRKHNSAKTLRYGDIDDYRIVKLLGEGRFGKIYECIGMKDEEKSLVVKILKPCDQRTFKQEVYALTTLTQCPQIPKIVDVISHPVTFQNSIVTENINGINLKAVMYDFEISETIQFSYQLLQGLKYAHSNKIIHKDIKPQNIIVNRSNRRLNIVDWGSSEFIKNPGKKHASLHYRAPELLLQHYYSYPVDIWAFGCVLLSIVTKKCPFFNGLDINNQLESIINILGTDVFFEYVDRHHVKLNDYYCKYKRDIRPRCWRTIVGGDKQTDLISLLDGILQFDPDNRFDAENALKHHLFYNVYS